MKAWGENQISAQQKLNIKKIYFVFLILLYVYLSFLFLSTSEFLNVNNYKEKPNDVIFLDWGVGQRLIVWLTSVLHGVFGQYGFTLHPVKPVGQ